MTKPCGCCEGVSIQTPIPIENRPGLDVLVYRVGTHSAFLASMEARLGRSIRPLKTREGADPALALLDAWATVGDVLTFYQERIANEGYLRTATERFSVISLANLVGYAPRPGVAAGVALAYTLQPDSRVTIPAGSRAQSVPGPGELPQFFETSSDLEARAEWNALTPRLTQPQALTLDILGGSSGTGGSSGAGGSGAPAGQDAAPAIYLDGLVTRLKPNDSLLFVFGPGADQQVWRRVQAVDVQAAQGRTKVTLLPFAPPPAAVASAGTSGPVATLAVASASAPVAVPPSAATPPAPPATPLPPLTAGLLQVLTALQKAPSTPGAVPRDARGVFASDTDASAQLLLTVDPRVRTTLYPALAAAAVTPALALLNLYALRVKAAPFGHNAPRKPVLDSQGIVQTTEEWPLADPTVVGVALTLTAPLAAARPELARSKTENTSGEAPNGSSAEAGGLPVESVTLFAQTGDSNTVAQVQGVATGSYPSGGGSVIVEVDVTRAQQTFRFTQVPQTIILAATASVSAVSVTVSGGAPQLVVLGQTLQYAQGGDVIRIATAASPGLVSIQVSVETLSGPSEQDRSILLLDSQYDQILPGSWVLITRPDPSGMGQKVIFAQVQGADTVSQTAYGFTNTVTKLTLDQDWLDASDRRLDVVRNTVVYAQSEALTLTDGPVTAPPADNSPTSGSGSQPPASGSQPPASGGQSQPPAGGSPAPDGDDQPPVSGDSIPLDSLYDGLKAGRWLVVAGERADAGVQGVPAAELVQLANVTQGFAPATADPNAPPLPGDTLHSTLHLTSSLAYAYKRSTLTIYGNVVAATHGQTQAETLGSGDAGQSFQTFALHQKPLTFLSAPTESGAADTLQVRVNSVLWHEADALSDLGPNDHGYVTQTDDNDQTSVIFGNGVQGARPPNGAENIRAVYRSGIGTPGNLAAGRISQLATRPLGVKAVVNPLLATGGADREDRDTARRNAALAVKALDRLVSVQDYEDFARAYAGIGKAAAELVTGGLRPRVSLTVAGPDDSLLTTDSDLLKNLLKSLRDFGDPDLGVGVVPATRTLLIFAADIVLLPDYEWNSVAAQIRQSVEARFAFAVRDLGQGVPKSEAVAALQSVEGVSHVAFTVFDSFPLDPSDKLPERLAALAAGLGDRDRIAAGSTEVVFFSPDVPDTLLLTEATDAPDA